MALLWVNNGQDCRIYRIYRMDCLKLNRALKWTGLQDLQDRLFWRCCGLTMDRIAGLQDLQDRMVFLGLSRGLNMDRITRLQDLQEGLF